MEDGDMGQAFRQTEKLLDLRNGRTVRVIECIEGNAFLVKVGNPPA